MGRWVSAVVAWLAMLATTATAAATGTCEADATQFEVSVAADGPLGLRLSANLEILEFLVDKQGRSREVEASGLAEIGDRLIQVNGESLEQDNLSSAIEKLKQATMPKLLRFQSHNERCMEQQTSAPHDGDPAAVRYDYVLLSIGEKESEETYYAVLSGDGTPPSCSFREIALADPVDACSPLTSNTTDKYLLVPSVFGCPAHQKAVFAQEAGAKGVVIIQRMEAKPQQVKIPADLPQAIRIPLVMLSMDSGVKILERMMTVLPDEILRLRFVFSEECAAEMFEVHPDDDPHRQSIALLTESAIAGFLSVSVASSGSTNLMARAFEFLKPGDLGNSESLAKLPLGKQKLYFPTGMVTNMCAFNLNRAPALPLALQEEIQDAFVVLEEHPRCSIVRQLEFFSQQQALGVVFVDPEFPRTSKSAEAIATAQLSTIPFVFVSMNAFETMRLEVNSLGSDAVHVLVEFSGANALNHHWDDLMLLSDSANWPSSKRARDRLFHRMLKDHATTEAQEAQLSMSRSERYEALVASYNDADQFHAR